MRSWELKVKQISVTVQLHRDDMQTVQLHCSFVAGRLLSYQLCIR